MQTVGPIQNVQAVQTPTDNRQEVQKSVTPTGNQLELDCISAPKRFRAWAWECTLCEQECVPVRTESRCLCGHRMKEHDKPAQPGEITVASRCKALNCPCKTFCFIVAEGSWVLHCRCKHKHTDHDPVTKACRKSNCACDGFFSPWVCNCDHPWSAHRQVVKERQVKTVEQMMAEACIAEDVNRHDLIQRGLD